MSKSPILTGFALASSVGMKFCLKVAKLAKSGQTNQAKEGESSCGEAPEWHSGIGGIQQASTHKFCGSHRVA